jgi:hypothetical protein
LRYALKRAGKTYESFESDTRAWPMSRESVRQALVNEERALSVDVAQKLLLNFGVDNIIDDAEFFDMLSFIPKSPVDVKLYVVVGNPKERILEAIGRSARLAQPTRQKISDAVERALTESLREPNADSVLVKFVIENQPTALAVELSRLGKQYGKMADQTSDRRGHTGK